jgi:hypothetical protein
MYFRQISLSEWVNNDYRAFVHILVSSSDLAEKFNLKFEDYWEDGLGESKIAYLRTNEGMQFYIAEFPSNKIIMTHIGCLNNGETIARDIDTVLEMLELSSENVNFVYNDVKLISHQLWRQDDNGHKFLIETFPCRADAVKAMKEFEARLHKQTYWIEKVI